MQGLLHPPIVRKDRLAQIQARLVGLGPGHADDKRRHQVNALGARDRLALVLLDVFDLAIAILGAAGVSKNTSSALTRADLAF